MTRALLESAHQGLLDTQRVGSPTALIDAQLATLTGTSRAADQTFGDFTRGIQQIFGGVLAVVNDAEVAARCERVRDAVLPHGVNVVQWKYTDKAGEVEMAAARRTSEVNQVLDEVKLPGGGTLATVVEAWTAAGRTLGANESRRGELERERAAVTGEAVSGQDVLDARRRWVKVAQMLRADVEMAELEPAQVECVLGDLDRAIERASAPRAEGANEESEGEGIEAPAVKAGPVVLTPEAPANDTKAEPARKTG